MGHREALRGPAEGKPAHSLSVKAVKPPPRLGLEDSTPCPGRKIKGTQAQAQQHERRSVCFLSFSVVYTMSRLRNRFPSHCKHFRRHSLPHLLAQHRARHAEAWPTLGKRPPLRSLLIAVCAPFLEGTAWHHPLKVAQPQKKTLLKVTCKPRGKRSSMSLQKIERSANILVFP